MGGYSILITKGAEGGTRMSQEAWRFVQENRGLILNAVLRATKFYNFHDFNKREFTTDIFIDAVGFWDNIDTLAEEAWERKQKKREKKGKEREEKPEEWTLDRLKKVYYNKVYSNTIWKIKKVIANHFRELNEIELDKIHVTYGDEENHEFIDSIGFLKDYEPEEERASESYYSFLTGCTKISHIRKMHTCKDEDVLREYLKTLKEKMLKDDRVKVKEDGTIIYKGEKK